MIGVVLFIVGMVFSVFLGFRAGSILNWQTIVALLAIEALSGFWHAQSTKNREFGNKDIVDFAIIFCVFLFTVSMIFTASETLNWDDRFANWIKDLTHR